MASTTFFDAVNAAVEFLSCPISGRCTTTMLVTLQNELQAQLLKHFAPRSLGGSTRRGLLFTRSVPPRPIRDACVAAGAAPSWPHWFAHLVGGAEFELFVDASAVTVVPSGSLPFSVWAGRLKDAVLADVEVDGDDLFAALENERRQAWLGATLNAFPPVPSRLAVPSSTLRGHSRTASFSSISSASSFASSSTASGASFSSVDTASSRASSPSSSPFASPVDRACSPPLEVFIDRTKTELARYDGGKTSVLTGGVMLGGKPAAPKPTERAPLPASWWRAPRA